MADFLRVERVARRYDVSSGTIWRWSRNADYAHMKFPKPVKLGPATTAWSLEELDAYDEKLMAQRERNSMR